MGPKTWPTVSEETGHCTAAAWRWLHEGSGLQGVPGGARVNLAAGLFSKLMTLGIAVAEDGSDRF